MIIEGITPKSGSTPQWVPDRPNKGFREVYSLKSRESLISGAQTSEPMRDCMLCHGVRYILDTPGTPWFLEEKHRRRGHEGLDPNNLASPLSSQGGGIHKNTRRLHHLRFTTMCSRLLQMRCINSQTPKLFFTGAMSLRGYVNSSCGARLMQRQLRLAARNPSGFNGTTLARRGLSTPSAKTAGASNSVWRLVTAAFGLGFAGVAAYGAYIVYEQYKSEQERQVH
eukprot:1344558-Amorphochlora_amoeboformis.AAC.1